ncbi:MAG: 4-alpha-glucanotransferase [Clostridia bacterium]|nr:4-alpha-glucanotransferase [Clostridia bacterium]
MRRSSGILLHIATLPGDYGIGSLGKQAYFFADFLHKAGQSYWQILPLVPTGYGNSPYQSCCSYAGNEFLIDLDLLKEQGLLGEEDLSKAKSAPNSRIDYESLFQNRISLLKVAFSRLDKNNNEFLDFLKRGEYNDYSLFRAIKEQLGYIELSKWPDEYKHMDADAIKRFENSHKNDILFYQWTQFEFSRQWNALKSYVNSLGVKIIGDIPIYVSRDSVECWTQPELFKLDENLFPKTVAGCPPDYFSETGQLWGNPIYEWDKMKEDGYKWWENRMRRALKLYDVIRIDHFRGFDRFYEIPAYSPDARTGHWSIGPGASLFEILRGRISDAEIIAEDLGDLDDSCKRMFKEVGYPGMKVLSFAFDSDEHNAYLPSNFENDNSVCYTGTHDNDTLMSLIEHLGARREEFKRKVSIELAKNDLSLNLETNSQIADAIIELTLSSKSKVAILPLQDWTKTGSEGRINTPSTLSLENWSYRIDRAQLSEELAGYILNKVKKYNR